MVYIRERKRGSTFYYVLVESIRTNGKVRQRTVKYLGNREKMLEYCKRHNVTQPAINYAMLDKSTTFMLEAKLAKLNKLRPLPHQTVESLRKKFEVEMTYNSNAIEGNKLTLKETFLVLEKGITIGGRSMRDHLEATNHKEALALLEKMANNSKLANVLDILNLHAAILDKISPQDAGVYRRYQVLITQSKHRPPKWKEVPELMKQVIQELNSKRKGAAAIESAVKVHHLVAWVHPFGDGNGRLARLLMNLRLMRAGFPPVIVEKKIRKSYYDALENADGGDYRHLAALVAQALKKSLDLWLSVAE